MWIYDFPLRLQVVYQNLLLQFFSNMECDCAANNFKSTPILHIFRRLHPTWTRCAAVFSFPAVYNGKEMTMMSSKGKIFDGSCVSKMMILLIILLCCYVFQVFVPVLVSSRGGGLIFFCRSSTSLCSLATSRRYASILQSLWFMCILVAI